MRGMIRFAFWPVHLVSDLIKLHKAMVASADELLRAMDREEFWEEF